MSPDVTSSDRDEQLFKLLDDYVSALRGANDDIPDPPDELIEAFPDLADMLNCLDSLEELVPLSVGAVDPEILRTSEEETFVPGTTPGVSGSIAKSEADPGEWPCDFGRYELIEEIGRGGMGIVYLARQKQLNAMIALKLVGRSQFASAEEVRRFYSEARAAAGLRHPNIVCVHDVGDCLGQHYLTMDFVRGGSLADRLKDGPLQPREAAELLLTVARAVEYLHRHKIVHRDLKPSNIMLDEEGVPHVTDFGLAKVFEGDSRETASGTIIGTPAYMAPEQASGRSSQVSPQSDVYSLGAILYEMLTGQPPFAEDNPLDTLLQVIEATPDPMKRLNPDVPQALEAICLHCLEKNPEDRFASAEAFAAELDHYLKGEPVELPPRSVWDRVVGWARREPAMASRLGVLTVASTIIQLYYQLGGHRDLGQHLEVMGVMGLWILLSFMCMRLQWKEEWEMFARFLWSASDAACYTAVLCLADADEPLGPVLIGYPVLIVGAGLWSQMSLVTFMTIVTTVSYAFLAWLRNGYDTHWHYPVIFMASLIGTGFIVAYQVYRLRMLSRYFERRRP